MSKVRVLCEVVDDVDVLPFCLQKVRDMAKHRQGRFALKEAQLFFEIMQDRINSKAINHLNVNMHSQQIAVLLELRTRASGEKDNDERTTGQKNVEILRTKIDAYIAKLFERIQSQSAMVVLWTQLRHNFKGNDNVLEILDHYFFQFIRAQCCENNMNNDDEANNMLNVLTRKTNSPRIRRSISMMRKINKNPNKAVRQYNRIVYRRNSLQSSQNDISSTRSTRGKTL